MFIESDLLNEVTLEGDVLAGSARKCHGGDVGQSLCLMDESVSEGQDLPVLEPNLTMSDHPAQLLLELVFEMKSFCFDKDSF